MSKYANRALLLGYVLAVALVAAAMFLDMPVVGLIGLGVFAVFSGFWAVSKNVLKF
jgi:uncharacterized membrane protein